VNQRARSRTYWEQESTYEHPTRAELWGVEQLEAHAFALSQRPQLVDSIARIDLDQRLQRNALQLRRAYTAIAAALRAGRAITPAAEWLLDNFHVIADQATDIPLRLTAKAWRSLPAANSANGAGWPRIFDLVREYLAHTHGELKFQTLGPYLLSYQRVAALQMRELWALYQIVRIALIDELRRLAMHMEAALSARGLADEFANRILTHDVASSTPLPLLDVMLRAPRYQDPFVVQLAYRLQSMGHEGQPVLDQLAAQLHAQGRTIDEVIQSEHARRSASNLTVRNIMTSLRALASFDWRGLFECCAPVELRLQTEPSYRCCDRRTRDRYRDCIEDLALLSGRAETEIAAAVLRRLAGGDIGELLIGTRRADLEASIGFTPTSGRRLKRWIIRHAARLYAVQVASVTAGIVAMTLHWSVGEESIAISALFMLGALAAFPASELALAMINRLWISQFPPRHLPRLSMAKGLNADQKTLVVMPVMLRSVDEALALVRALQVHALGNMDAQVRFALISDWPDAAQASSTADETILEAANAAIAALNAQDRNAPENEPRFYLLHRRRRWNKGEGCFMGWERKRGKLVELNRLLLGATDTSFTTADGVSPRMPLGVRYVLTLDADTRLPLGTVRELVAIAAHRLNQPIFDPAKQRVVRGYALFQPRITPLLPRREERSAYRRIVTGGSGLDPYAAAVSDLYQDVFGEGVYTGKGLYELVHFEAAMAGRVPENSMLSHDLFEGLFTRCALVSDVELFEDFPSHSEVAAARAHRWIRGDWQLWPWIVGAHGSLPPLGRWKMLDNLRRSLLSPAAVALLAVALSLPSIRLNACMALIAAPWLWPALTNVARRLLRHGSRRLSCNAWREVASELLADMARAMVMFGFLAQNAWVSLDAIARTAVRMTLTHRKRLEWTTAAQSKAHSRHALDSFVWSLKSSFIVVTGVAALIVWLNPTGLWLALPLLGLWWVTPLMAHILSRPSPRHGLQEVLSETDTSELHSIAHDTWQFFDTFVTAEDHFLPPDNFQEDPVPIIAHRTSPTNIGLYLLSCVAARDFGWLQTAQLADRVTATLNSLERLERYNGHFLNWYDTRTLLPLEPRYVSTVDSGNLAGHLLTLRQALLDVNNAPALAGETLSAQKDAPLQAQLQHLAKRCANLVEAMQFGFLYDQRSGLFSIGYRVTENTLDDGHYDLLASEARLASLVAIAKGDVPPSHWFRLGRRLTGGSKLPALASWSGSIFEYLMPALVMREPRNSLLGQTSRNAIEHQIQFAATRALPWGVSESAYNARDREHTYQYSAFGLPSLGLKRGLSADQVVAPYATGLAATYRPVSAARNFRALNHIGARGRYGYFDAIDFTPKRLPANRKAVVVRTFMAHHQGMTLVALDNALHQRIMQRRFHDEPMIAAADLLLQEGSVSFADAPALVEVEAPSSESHQEGADLERHVQGVGTQSPVTHLLSNRHYSVMLTDSGAGYSRCRALAVTRWREDSIQEGFGGFVYLRDARSGDFWSCGYQPTAVEPDEYSVLYKEERVAIRRRDRDISSLFEVIVAAEDDGEMRRVTLRNEGDDTREIELTSYAEIVLAPQRADIAHPGFSNLFVNTEFASDSSALLASRRPRGTHESAVWAAHVLSTSQSNTPQVQYETDRLRFIGRGNNCGAPAAITEGRPLSNTLGPVLDPIFSLRTSVRLEPGQTATIMFATLIAPTREQVLALAAKYRHPAIFEHSTDFAWTFVRAELHHLQSTLEEARLFQTLAASLVFAHRSQRAAPDVIAGNRLGVAHLWRFSISGDRPILLICCRHIEDERFIRQCLRAQEYLRTKRLFIDVVILNELQHSYMQDLQDSIERIVRTCSAVAATLVADERGTVHTLRSDAMSAEERTLLLAVARVVLRPAQGSLAEQLRRPEASTPRRDATTNRRPAKHEAPPEGETPTEPAALEFFNGIGGFASNGREYVMLLEPGIVTPAPWTNVIANEQFGSLVTESGTMCTWSLNSRENQLTAWSNDPVSDPSGEALYIRDDETEQLWSPTAQPIRLTAASYESRHGQGYSRFLLRTQGIASDLHVFVAPDDPVKIGRLRLTNHSAHSRQLTIALYVAWSLGPDRATGAPNIVTEMDVATGAMFARNSSHIDFGSRIAFCDLGGRQQHHTGRRREFLGRNGQLGSPEGMHDVSRWSGRVGAGFDPCTAFAVTLKLNAGQSDEISFTLGQAEDTDAARALVERYRTRSAQQVLAQVQENWNDLLSAVQIHTPDRALDLLFNRWLLYQVVSCRLWGRAGFYQAGGAYGFRDQLQDGMAVAISRPALTRAHLLRAAARQFTAGDVQHWWHPPSGRGVRTHCSDDRLWLPFAVFQYLRVTGDQAVMEEAIAFLEGPELPLEQEDAHFEPQVSASMGTLYEHCARALDVSLQTGVHGLPLIGSGDWNDGMNRIGKGGRGESVWLAWFLILNLRQFAPIAAARGEDHRARRWVAQAQALTQACEAHGWDGAWYRRAFFDDGSALGSAANFECRIDSIAQSWAVLSGAANPQRAAKAMAAVEQYLTSNGDGLVLLFAPPFDLTQQDPGYVKAYLPGIRENGAQYTHAAIWVLMAQASLGNRAQVGALLESLNPVRRTQNRNDVHAYRVEPYVIAADIYSAAPHTRRGGWTWYTGAASWFYQAILESVLGVDVRADTVTIEPCLPADWPGFELTLRRENTSYLIQVVRAAGPSAAGILIDGIEWPSGPLKLVTDGRQHIVRVALRNVGTKTGAR
jgi:cyclic beta-1,2-glucan synthetase